MFKLTLLVCLTLAIFVNCEEKNAKQYFAPAGTTSTGSSGLSGSSITTSSGNSGSGTVGLLSGPGGQPGTLSGGGGGSPVPAPQTTTLAPGGSQTESTTQGSSSSSLSPSPSSSSSEMAPTCDIATDCLDASATVIADPAVCTATSPGCNSLNIDPKPVCTCVVP